MRLLPNVTPRTEYSELVDVLREPARWKEAHALFTKIRVNITLPLERERPWKFACLWRSIVNITYPSVRRWREVLDVHFVYVAENAAKTAYNCSGESAPFDDDSFDWLLRCEQQCLDKLRHD